MDFYCKHATALPDINSCISIFMYYDEERKGSLKKKLLYDIVKNEENKFSEFEVKVLKTIFDKISSDDEIDYLKILKL